jgi:hypothetical protein
VGPPPRSTQRHDGKTAIEAELQAIEDAEPLPADDLSLLDELPYAPGLLARAPDDLREKLAAAFDMQCVYRPDIRQATVSTVVKDFGLCCFPVTRRGG